MAYKLFLKPITVPAALGEEAAGLSAEPLFNWVLTDATGERIADGAALSVQEIATVLQQQNVSQASVIGVIPAERVFTAEVAVPAKQQRYVAQALPFAVEELLAEDLEEVHLVPGKKNKIGKYPVAVINKAYFAAILDALKSSNLVLDQVIAEGDMVPWQDGTVSVILDDQQALVNYGQHGFCKVDIRNLPLLMDSIRQMFDAGEVKTDIPVSIYLHGAEKEQYAIDLAAIEQISGMDLKQDVFSSSLLSFLVAGKYSRSDSPLDFCLGEFKQKEATNSHWRKWLGVAAVGFLWLVSEVSLNVGKGIYYQTQADSLRASAFQEYKKHFPDDRRVTEHNVKKYLESKLRAAQNQGGNFEFLNVLSEAGQHYKSVSNNGKPIEFKSINFSEQRSELTLELNAQSLDQLDRLKSGIAGEGYEAKISSAIKEKDYIRGRLTVAQR